MYTYYCRIWSNKPYTIVVPIILMHLNDNVRGHSFANEKEIVFTFLDRFYPYFEPNSSCASYSVTYLSEVLLFFFSVVLNSIEVGSSNHYQDLLPCNASSWDKCVIKKNVHLALSVFQPGKKGQLGTAKKDDCIVSAFSIRSQFKS